MIRRFVMLLGATAASSLLAARADAADRIAAPPPRELAPPHDVYTYTSVPQFPTLAWTALQLIPSPELAVGRGDDGRAAAAFGFRWQVTPVLWSWGTNRHISRWRFFVVDPLARVAGSIAFETDFEYIMGHVARGFVRPAVTATLPLVHRGEYLAFSLGTSVYQYDDRARLAHELGLYFLYGTIGFVAAYAPDNPALMTLGTLRLRYF